MNSWVAVSMLLFKFPRRNLILKYEFKIYSNKFLKIYNHSCQRFAHLAKNSTSL